MTQKSTQKTKFTQISTKQKSTTKFLYKVKYVLQKLLDNSELWLEALLSRIEGGFQSKKTLDRPAGPIVAASGKRGCTQAAHRKPDGQPTRGVCGTQVTRVRIYGGVV